MEKRELLCIYSEIIINGERLDNADTANAERLSAKTSPGGTLQAGQHLRRDGISVSVPSLDSEIG